MEWGVGVGGPDKLSTLESTDLLDLEIWAVEERKWTVNDIGYCHSRDLHHDTDLEDIRFQEVLTTAVETFSLS